MASNSVTIGQILEKLPSKDKDFRYMATSDLQNELLKPSFRVDQAVERKLCNAVLQQLQDISGDISALAVKCLGLLVKKVDEPQVDLILNHLSGMITGGKQSQNREIASLGLKAVIADLPTGKGAQPLIKRCASVLIHGLQTQVADIVNACLEVLDDLVSKYGSAIEAEHVQMEQALLTLIQQNKASHRKRALHCLGSAAPYFNEQLLSQTVESMKEGLTASPSNGAAKLTYIHAVGTLRSVKAHLSAGWRMEQHLAQLIPLSIKYRQEAGEGDDELQEACLQALEAFVERSPQGSEPFIESIFQQALESLTYDPNYNDNMEAEEDEEDDEDEDELSDEGYSDDEDTSWKVRRAATKLLSAIITGYPNLLAELYPNARSALTARFREREETVKIDTFNALVDLIRQVRVVDRQDQASQLAADVPGILKAASKSLRDKSVKIRAGVFQVLKELVIAVPSSFTQEIDQLMPGIIAALKDKSSSASALKIQALQFLGLALQRASQQIWQPQIGQFGPPVIQAVSDKYYKVSAQAIRVCEELVSAIRPAPAQRLQPGLQQLVEPLFEAIQQRLAAQDQDQEVKEAAISCAATITAGLGDFTNGAYHRQIKILLERLQNDVTRLVAVKAFAKIAQSPLDLALASYVKALIIELINFLRKANRPLRQASLATLNAILHHRDSVNAVPVEDIVSAVAQLVNDADLLLTSASLYVGSALLHSHPASASSVSSKMLPPALLLAQSTLLQGSALDALKGFFIALLLSQTPSCSFESLLNSLLAAGNKEDAGRVAQNNIAKCIAALCQAAGPTKTASTVQSLLALLLHRSSQASAKHLALLAVGEIGRSTDLSSFSNLQQTLTSSLASSSDELKTAAALSLGAVAVGNLSNYLPFILQQIHEKAANPKDQYLLFRALNVVITSVDSRQLPPNYQSEALNLLLQNCESEEECRNTVAECLGHLALLNPPDVIPVLLQNAQSPSSPTRATVVIAMKSTIVDGSHPVDPHLQSCLPSLLALLSDADRRVRKAAIQLLSIAAHNKAALVREQLPGLLPALYQQTQLDPSLIRTVELGPFQHKVDDGLELRKATFECLDVLLENASDRLQMPEFIKHLKDGLQDHYDVKMPCHLLLAKVASKAGSHVLAALDSLVKPLEKTLATRVKTDAVKQEVDRNEDMLRSCLRSIDACTRIPNVETSAGFRQFMDRVVLVGPNASKFKAVQDERAEAEGRSTKTML